MKLFLLPISTRRALIYCEPLSNLMPVSKQSYLDRAVSKANTTWATWEKDTKAIGNWKKRTTNWGNIMLRRIPFEEWSLKSIPPLGKRPTRDFGSGEKQMLVGGAVGEKTERVEVRYPALYQALGKESVTDVLRRLSTERQGLHSSRLKYCVVGMPLTIPFGLLPIIPNIPFFYLAFRAYSHWTALRGSKHLEHLVNTSTLRDSPSLALDALYTAGLLHPTPDACKNQNDPTLQESKDMSQKIKTQLDGSNDEEVMLLKAWNGKVIAERLKLPGLEVEIDRAVEQVEKGIKDRRDKLAQAVEAKAADQKQLQEDKPTPR